MRMVSSRGQKHWLFGMVALATVMSGACSDGGGGDDDDATPAADQDGDGFTSSAGDCDDTNADVYLGATEVCDGIDNNCDGAIDENADADDDGFLSEEECPDTGDDCDDTNPNVNPGEADACDGVDNDCDGAVDETFDADQDGEASSETCASGTDCDDTDPAINSLATEVCDGADNDCDTLTDEGFDADQDGYYTCGEDGERDCNDSEPSVNPGALEILDGLDNDCVDGIELTNFDLTYADLRLTPTAGYSLINHSVASVGDVNGDGFDDIFVGIPKRTNDPQYRGGGFLIFGRALGADPISSTMEAESFLLTGTDGGENAGLASTWAGDLNGDGIDDLVVGGPRAGVVPFSNSGSVYILFGKSSGWSNGQALSTANVVIKGAYAGLELGSDLAGLGDINGDGIDDLLIGAQSSQANPTIPNGRNGRAFILLGRRNGWENVTSSDSLDASFLGEGSNEFAGAFVGAAGDINNDSFNDLIIGAPNNTDGGPNAGKTYVIFGSATPNWGVDFDLGRANVKITGGPNDGAVTVGSVTLIPTGKGVGDVDGDSIDDIIITAPNSGGGGASLVNNGKAYVIYGRTDWTGATSLTDAAGAIFYGEASGDQLGTDVAPLGDVNGDGFADFILSSPASDAGVVESEGGQTYVLLGEADRNNWASGGLFHKDVSFLGGTTGKVNTGQSLAGITDFNGDGLLDFTLAAADGTLFVVTDFAY